MVRITLRRLLILALALSVAGGVSVLWVTAGAAVSPKTPQEAFASLGSELERAFSFDADTGSWLQFNPLFPPDANSLKEMKDFQGYWLKMKSAATLQMGSYRRDLKPGWNLVGWVDPGLLQAVGAPSATPTLPSTPTATPPVAPTATPAADELVGQTVSFPGSLSFTGTVTASSRLATIGACRYDQQKTALGVYLILLMDVKNTGSVPSSVSTSSFYVKDAIGRKFSMAELGVQWVAECQSNRDGVYQTIQPGLTDKLVFVFDIAPDATGLYLVSGS